MDFLGLRNLDVIDGALDLIRDRRGVELDIESVALDDPGTYAMLARGDAIGVFQFESSGMREALREVGPTEFADLIALVALYRPGPMAFISTYARNKRDPSRVSFEDPRLESITGVTYGVAVYQEQLMAISRQLAGFSPSRADDLRKAVGKKDKVLMASLKDEFIAGCIDSGTAKPVAGSLWSLCEAAGDYSFNKSHAACYALLAYRTAYLKANHPAEYMASLLSSVMDTKDRVPFYVAACTDMGLSVLPPDVNVSRSDFAVTGETEIRFGLTAVKGVGENAVAAIMTARDSGGPFESIWDFCRRVDQAQVNKRALECLIRSGALDSTGATRLGMLEAMPAAVSQAARRRNDMAAGQESLFGAMNAAGADAAMVEPDPPIGLREMAREDLLAAEKEALGLYVSSHPLQDCRQQLSRAVTCGLAALADRADNETVTVGGIIGAVKNITTRRGEPMMFIRLDDLEGSVEVVVVPAVLTEARDLLAADRMVVIAGRVDQKGEGETKLVAQVVTAFTPEEGAEEERLVVRVHVSRLAETHLGELRRLLVDHRGSAPVVVDVQTEAGRRRLHLGEEFRVDPQANGLVAELKTLFGERCLA
jgi:DNA polymerase-3 subunit alpha